MEIKVNQDMAEADFQRMVEAAEIDVEGMNDKELAEFEDMKSKFIRKIMVGKMSVDDEGLPTIYTRTQEVPELKFKIPYTDTIIAQGRVLNGNEAARARTMLAETTGVPAKKISVGVTAKDFVLAQMVLGFFLGN